MELQHLVRRVPAGKAEELGEIAQGRARVTRARSCSGHLRRASGRAHEPDGDLHEGRFARAVRAEEPDELALADLEVDALQRIDRAVALAKPANGKGSRHAIHSTLGPCRADTWKGLHPRRPSGGRRSTRAES